MDLFRGEMRNRKRAVWYCVVSARQSRRFSFLRGSAREGASPRVSVISRRKVERGCGAGGKDGGRQRKRDFRGEQ